MIYFYYYKIMANICYDADYFNQLISYIYYDLNIFNQLISYIYYDFNIFNQLISYIKQLSYINILILNFFIIYFILYYIDYKFGFEYKLFTYFIKTKKNPARKSTYLYKNKDELIKNNLSFNNFNEFYDNQYPIIKKFYKNFNDKQIYDYIRKLNDHNFVIISL